MKYFRYQEDRIPVAIISLLFAADIGIYFTINQLSFLTGWMLIGLLAKSFIAAWNHHHQHVNTFRQVWLNRLLEIIYTFHTGISTNVWVLHHNLGHHLHYLDQAKDESGWKRKDGTMMNVWEYTITIALTGYPRAIRVGRKHPKFQRGLTAMGLINAGILSGLLFYRPVPALLVFVIPMIVIYFGTCWTTYYHHAGLDTEDELHASHNIVNRWYNILSGNLGYHTAHHMKQGVHWSQLPQLHKNIEKDIPEYLISHEFPVVGWIRRKVQDFFFKETRVPNINRTQAIKVGSDSIHLAVESPQYAAQTSKEYSTLDA